MDLRSEGADIALIALAAAAEGEVASTDSERKERGVQHEVVDG